jgi:hypothetical protein
MLNGAATVENNTNNGIAVSGSSSAQLNGPTTVGSNAGTGISVATSSGVQINGTTTVGSNAGWGINASATSNIMVSAGAVAVQNNAAGGVMAVNSSNIYLTGAMNILNNLNSGLWLTQSTMQVIGGATTKLTISGTTGGAGNGILLNTNSSLRVDASLLVENNTGSGIYAHSGCQFVLFPASSHSAVIKNNGYGVQLWSGSAIDGTTVSVTGSTANDIKLGSGSRASINNLSYGTCTSDGTGLVTGFTCPLP